MRARQGGALYPVLLIGVMLFGMSMALPQVLIGAGSTLRLDSGRDRKREALESAVAFAEARLKRELRNLVVTGPAGLGVVMPAPGAAFPLDGLRLASLGRFTVRPSFANPDYGRRRNLDWEVRCMKVGLWGYEKQDDMPAAPVPGGPPPSSGFTERYRFNYLLDAASWSPEPEPGKPRPLGAGGGPELHEEIAGTIEVKVAVDLGQTGVPIRTVKDVRIAAMAQPRFDAFDRSALPTPEPGRAGRDANGGGGTVTRRRPPSGP